MPRGLEPAPSGVELLPSFDEYVLGYQDRASHLGAQVAARIVPGNNGVFLPTIVVNGEVIGTWKRDFRSKSVSVELLPFSTLSAKANAKARQFFACYAAFLSVERFDLN